MRSEGSGKYPLGSDREAGIFQDACRTGRVGDAKGAVLKLMDVFWRGVVSDIELAR
jgi:hypothetical protein